MAQIGDCGHQALLAFHQLFFVQLDIGDVGADGNVAAVLGPAFADVEPPAVIELGLEGTGAGNLALAGDPRAHDRLTPGATMRTRPSSRDGKRTRRKIAAPPAPMSANSSATRYPRRPGIVTPHPDVSAAIMGRDAPF